MEFKLKTISKDSLSEAISKAELYRYLNEPEEAESICHDVLAIEPNHQLALRLLGLAITDEFKGDVSDRYAEAERAFERLTDPFEHFYYMGLLHERRAKAQLRAGRSPHTVFVLFEEAMRWFEKAEEVRPEGNDDAILRWNRCVRLVQSYLASELHREEAHTFEASDSPPI